MSELEKTISDHVKKLEELLDIIPDMNNSDDFDNELQKRRKELNYIKAEYDSLHRCVEKIWVTKAWDNVKDKRRNYPI